MRSVTRAAFAARSFTILSLLYTSSVCANPLDDAAVQPAALEPRAVSRLGCYSSNSGFTSAGTYLYQSSSYCGGKCPSYSAYALTDGNACFCGNSLPPSNTKVDDSKCNMGCTGFPSDNCGGDGFYMIYASGNGVVGGSSGSSSSSSDPSSTSDDTATSSTAGASTATQVVTSVQPGHTVVVTQPASTSNSSSSNGGGSNTVGIAVGVVVGIIALGAIVGGVYFFLRRRRQQQIEDEHRQRTQVSDFMAGGMERKNAGTSYSHRSDARLDPEAGRRNSVGSFMDDSQDYSRKILRVANPDH